MSKKSELKKKRKEKLIAPSKVVPICKYCGRSDWCCVPSEVLMKGSG
jgi:hypothetical protein